MATLGGCVAFDDILDDEDEDVDGLLVTFGRCAWPATRSRRSSAT